MADALVLGTSRATCAGSTPALGTHYSILTLVLEFLSMMGILIIKMPFSSLALARELSTSKGKEISLLKDPQ